MTDIDRASRRAFLAGGGILAAGLFAGCNAAGDGASGTNATNATTNGTANTTDEMTTGTTKATAADASHSSPDLETFVADLTFPDTMEPAGKKDGHPHYEVMMREATHSFHPDLTDTTIWGYEGQFPGPTFEVERGQTISVHWANDELPKKHIFPVDTSISGQRGNPEVRTVVHLHGANENSVSDGYPEAWYTPDGKTTGAYYAGETYTYQNRQPATTLWYHDHALAANRLNVYAGLAGLYSIQGNVGGTEKLPSGKYERPLILQDRAFDEDGSPFYPGPKKGGIAPSVVPEFFGDVATVNGKAWPRFEVEPRKYRFRMLNASNARVYRLALEGYNEKRDRFTGKKGPDFVQVASEGGYLNEPVRLSERLLLGAGQRGQWVVDFSNHAGETLLLHNDANAPYAGGDPSRENESPLPKVMLFDVKSESVTDDSSIPDSIGPLPRLGGTKRKTKNGTTGTKPVPEISESDAVARRTLTLTESTDEHGRNYLLLDGLPYSHEATERPTVGTTEVWNLVNTSDDAHPIHLHLVQFQVRRRQGFDTQLFENSGAISPTSDVRGPSDQEHGWRDIVIAPPGEITTIVAHFGAIDGLFRDITGRFVWHCHMLEHSNHGMIRPLEVDPKGYGEE